MSLAGGIQFVLVLFFGLNVWAFPDTIRHGYTNCTSCHVSPAGGGLVNNYGRSLSRELISTWGYKNEELPLNGLIEIPESTLNSFFVGGDARRLSTRTESNGQKTGSDFLMQAQLRFGFAVEKFKWVMSLGKIENPTRSETVQWVSPEYYLMWNPQEQIFARAGRFEPLYGLRMPDHNLWIKSQVGLVPWSEKDTAEIVYEGEKTVASLSGFQSTSRVMPALQTTGFAASIYQVFAERHRLGIGLMNTEGQGTRSKAVTFTSALAFSEASYGLFEYTRHSSGGSNQDVGFLRLGYEVYKGIIPILQGQSRQVQNQSNQNKYRTGAGLIWYPRPHWEVMGLIEKEQGSSTSSVNSNLLVHFYL